MTLGNGVVETTLFDSLNGTAEQNTRLQPTHITAAKGTNSLLRLQYGYCAGALTGCTNNNGNVQTHTIGVGTTFNVSQTFGYDALDRLTSATEAGAQGWGEADGYDSRGNRWVVSVSGTMPELTAEIPSGSDWFTARNRMTAWSYDGAGNLLSSIGPAFEYDGENRLVKSTPNGGTATTYVYDGEVR